MDQIEDTQPILKSRASARSRRQQSSAAARSRTLVSAVLAGLLATAGVGTTGALGAARPEANDSAPLPESTGPAAGRTATVTLITGDVVAVTRLPEGKKTVTVEPAARESGRPVTFATASHGESYYVLPSDAAPYVAAGRLDDALFDVTALARDGYDDAADGGPPVIVQYRGNLSRSSLATRAEVLPGSPVILESIDAVAVDPTRQQRTDLWASLSEPAAASPSAGARLTRLNGGIEKVWLDAKTTSALDVSVPQIGAPAVWEAGYDGTGVNVAVLDTGIDQSHPDLSAKVVATKNFSQETSIADGFGHGTHVASIIAGTGAASGGRYKGVAPSASLMVGKVLNDNGTGQLSWSIEGMEWAAHAGADVVNLSLGSAPTDGTDPASQALDALSKETGTLFVVAAGNASRDATVSAPGAATQALTVGAVDDRDQLAFFSSRGPRLGDAAVKPNITAPGVNIIAARAAGTSMPGSVPVGDHYTQASGTSMATPHVAGAAALLVQAYPEWGASELKDALVSTAKPGNYTVFQQGAGRADVAKAFEQQVYGPATADFGRIADPGTDPVTRTLTYRNDTSSEVTLDLAATGRGWDGRTVPAGGLKLSAAQLTVPAGGSASVDLTVDPTAIDSGGYGGVVTATDADSGVSVRTPWSVYEASDSYTVNVQALDRRGNPAGPDLPVWIVKDDAGFSPNDPFHSWNAMGWTDESGQVSINVTAGVYDVYAQINTFDVTARESTIAIASEVQVSADKTVTLDARDGVLRNPRVGEPVDFLFGEVGFTRTTADGKQIALGGLYPQTSVNELYVTPTPDPKLGSADSFTKWIQASTMVNAHSVHGPRLELHPAYWPANAGPTLAGHRDLPVVLAGTGTAEELAGAAGKLALVRVPSPDAEPFTYNYYLNRSRQITDQAAAAGVAGVLMYADALGALGHPTAAMSTLYLGLSHQEGEALRTLVARNPHLRLVIDGRRSPERVYHVRMGGPGGFDRSAAPTIRDPEWTTIPARYHTDRPGQQGWLAWHAFSPIMKVSGQIPTPIWGGTAWTEFVASRGAELNWRRETSLEGTLIGSWDRFRGGEQRPVEDWFESPMHYGAMDVSGPYPAPLTCTFCRQGDKFVSGQYQMDASGKHYQFAWFAPPQVRLFAGDQEIPRQASPWRWWQVPPGPGTYRLNMVYTQPASSAPGELAPRTETDWVFHSIPPEPGQLPEAYGCPITNAEPCAVEQLIQLNYDLGLSLENSAPAGEKFTFDLRAAMPRGAIHQSPIAKVQVEFSTDGGQTWRSADVQQSGPARSGEFDVSLRHPALADTDGYVWLRVHAETHDGASVDQTVERAYHLAG
ncbi:S8 family peptidase [Micromonospora sp. NPDC005087]|uniref:S8 family peptidase n=1 Tax=Micromonospora sp. NPDC005087 TaxID=3364225 RepID=UPI0036AEBD9E